jgi:hypothetical protein
MRSFVRKYCHRLAKSCCVNIGVGVFTACMPKGTRQLNQATEPPLHLLISCHALADEDIRASQEVRTCKDILVSKNLL